jgi:predicted Rossmann fold flavoprotein
MNNRTEKREMKIAIIGGGAAGMMAAATLLEEVVDAEIHLFEKNNVLGKKVSISGGGRCNVTTGINDKNILLSKYTRGSKFLIPAFGLFPPDKVFKWFEEQGIPLKIKNDLRVFPKSDNGKDVVKLFEDLFKNKIKVHLDLSIESIEPTEKGFTLTTKNGKDCFGIVVITSGGNAYRHTGSTGDGYDFAKSCKHSITKLGPSLNSFEVKEDWCKELAGISLENAKLITNTNKEKTSAVGPFLFTHFGISGPVTFAFSSNTAFEKIDKKCPLKIGLIPNAEYNFNSLDKLLQNLIAENGAKQIINIISELTTRRLAEEILKISKINKDKKSAEIKKEERNEISHLLSGKLELNLIARRSGDEFVTAGGVDLNEVNRKTMESKILPNLYFAGEVLDIDGLTGGFNLQSAWATGRLAGTSIARKLKIEN